MPNFNNKFSLFTILALIVLSLAQTGPQAALIPSCVKSCDPAAIASVNCTNADQYCHCARQDGILRNISACANAECEHPSRDIYVFTMLFEEVCQKFNISVPVLGSNSSGNGTNVTVPAPAGPSTAPFVGAASQAHIRSNVLCVLSFGTILVAAALLL